MSNLYIPPGCKSLAEESDIPQIRLGIQGFGGTGKTWAALTFPNPIVLNLDRGLGAHVGRADVIEIPMYSESFCKTINPNHRSVDMKDTIMMWLKKEGSKLRSEQTLVVDSNTQIDNAYHSWFNENKMKFLTDKGVVDGFAEYKQKKTYFLEFLEILKYLPCHVVYLCHETEASIGKLAGKMRPLISGQVADSMSSYFTDFFRQLSATVPDDYTKVSAESLSNWKMTRAEFETWCKSFPRRTMYFWVPDGGSDFDGKCSSLVNYPAFLPADYSSFLKYRRKQTTKT